MTTLSEESPGPGVDSASNHKHLTFLLDGETYAVPVPHVRHVTDIRSLVHVIHGPKHQLGLMNYDGTLIPIVDLRHFFGLRAGALKATSVVIIMQVPCETGVEILGFAVDRVLAVAELESRAGLDGNPRALVSRLNLAAPPA
jgi:purine-binding chemotaxis protein CheW